MTQIISIELPVRTIPIYMLLINTIDHEVENCFDKDDVFHFELDQDKNIFVCINCMLFL